jgi:hypothetical protein
LASSGESPGTGAADAAAIDIAGMPTHCCLITFTLYARYPNARGAITVRGSAAALLRLTVYSMHSPVAQRNAPVLRAFEPPQAIPRADRIQAGSAGSCRPEASTAVSTASSV